MSDNPAETLESLKNKEHTPEDAVSFGRIVGGKDRSVAVCRDAGPGSAMLAKAAISGLLSVGTDVWDAGVMPLPAVILSSGEFDTVLSVSSPEASCRGGGLLPYNSDGRVYSDVQYRELFMKFRDRAYELRDYRGTGSIHRLERIAEEYIRAVSRRHNAPKSAVMLDCDCGCTALCAPQILSGIGADLISLNAHSDPDRRPKSSVADRGGTRLDDVIAANLGSIGIALNNDGTVISVSDERGTMLSPDEMLALLLAFLKPSCAVIPSETSSVVDDAFRGTVCGDMDTNRKANNTRRLIRTDGTADHTLKEIVENEADFGVLGDGQYVFPQFSLCPDGMVAAAVFAEMAVNNSINDLVSSFPAYVVLNDVVHCSGNKEMISKRITEKLHGTGSVARINGWRVEMPGGWFAVSFSENLSDYIDIKAESRDKTYAVTMIEYAKDLVRRCI